MKGMQMAEDEDIISADDEFEKLLQDFINAEVPNDNETKSDEEKRRRESSETQMSKSEAKRS